MKIPPRPSSQAHQRTSMPPRLSLQIGCTGLLGLWFVLADENGMRMLDTVHLELATATAAACLVAFAACLVASMYRLLVSHTGSLPIVLRSACFVIALISLSIAWTCDAVLLAIAGGAVAGICLAAAFEAILNQIAKAKSLSESIRLLAPCVLTVAVVRAIGLVIGSPLVWPLSIPLFFCACVIPTLPWQATMSQTSPQATSQGNATDNGVRPSAGSNGRSERLGIHGVLLGACLICAYIDGCFAIAVLKGSPIFIDTGHVAEWGYLVGMALAALVALLAARRPPTRTLILTMIVPVACIMVLMASQFFAFVHTTAVTIVMSMICGFVWSALNLLLLACVGGIDGQARQAAILSYGSAQAGTFLAAMVIWQIVGDELAQATCLACMAAYLASVAIYVLVRRSTFEAGTPAPTAQSEYLEARCRAIVDAYDLSSREAEVLSLLARGHSVPAIAEKLAISTNTAKTHASRIYKKMGIHTREELYEAIHKPMDTMDGRGTDLRQDAHNPPCLDGSEAQQGRA